MTNRTYSVEKNSIIDALDGVDTFVQGIEKINNDDKARSYEYQIGIDPIDGDSSKYAVHVTLI